MSKSVAVLKFGSSVLSSPADLPVVARIIQTELQSGNRVLVVVSAFAGVTDSLDAMCQRFVAPDDHLVAQVLSTGEATSATMLAMQLDEMGVDNTVLDPGALKLITAGPRLDASPVEVDVKRLRRRLKDSGVVIVSGFVGCDRSGSITLLGRGGSDMSAVFLAHQLGAAECRLVKDVPGVYPADPNISPAPAYPYTELDYERALEIAGALVQPKALQYARRWGVTFRVCSVESQQGTLVGPCEDRLNAESKARSRAATLARPGVAESSG